MAEQFAPAANQLSGTGVPLGPLPRPVDLPFNIPIGATFLWWTATAPTGCIFAQGQAVSREEYKEFFALVGTAFGVGDGSTTFNVPNLTKLIPVGFDVATAAIDTIGKTTGSWDHTHSTPAHTHTMANHTHSTPAHSHTGSVSMNAHSHSVNPHSHTFSGTTSTTSNSSNTGSGSAVQRNDPSHTHPFSGTTDSSSPSTDSQTVTGTVTINSGGSGTSGTPSTNTTDSGGGGTSGTANPPVVAVAWAIRVK